VTHSPTVAGKQNLDCRIATSKEGRNGKRKLISALGMLIPMRFS
jgi:hypothetical protein